MKFYYNLIRSFVYSFFLWKGMEEIFFKDYRYYNSALKKTPYIVNIVFPRVLYTSKKKKNLIVGSFLFPHYSLIWISIKKSSNFPSSLCYISSFYTTTLIKTVCDNVCHWPFFEWKMFFLSWVEKYTSLHIAFAFSAVSGFCHIFCRINDVALLVVNRCPLETLEILHTTKTTTMNIAVVKCKCYIPFILAAVYLGGRQAGRPAGRVIIDSGVVVL